jgi:hypothetical protein
VFHNSKKSGVQQLEEIFSLARMKIPSSGTNLSVGANDIKRGTVRGEKILLVCIYRVLIN